MTLYSAHVRHYYADGPELEEKFIDADTMAEAVGIVLKEVPVRDDDAIGYSLSVKRQEVIK